MEIRVHLTSGKEYRFSVEGEEESRALLTSVQPAKFFETPILQIQGESSTVSINPPSIEFVEFETTIDPGWPSRRGLKSARRISAEEYAGRLQEVSQGTAHDDAMTALAELTFRSGKTMCVEVSFVLEPGDDRRRVSLKVFEAPFVLLRQDDGRLVLLNPKNVDVFNVVPGPKEPSAYSWRAELKSS
jgi:hypothetical protein